MNTNADPIIPAARQLLGEMAGICSDLELNSSKWMEFRRLD
jgi:hypothetical protein